jgi:hypothetical protein
VLTAAARQEADALVFPPAKQLQDMRLQFLKAVCQDRAAAAAAHP